MTHGHHARLFPRLSGVLTIPVSSLDYAKSIENSFNILSRIVRPQRDAKRAGREFVGKADGLENMRDCRHLGVAGGADGYGNAFHVEDVQHPFRRMAGNGDAYNARKMVTMVTIEHYLRADGPNAVP